MSLSRDRLLIKEMKDSIGTKQPIVFFQAMTSVLESIVERLDNIEGRLEVITTQSSLGINWDPEIASEMLTSEIAKMREHKDIFSKELSSFKEAYTKGEVVKDYETFVKFWSDILGWHPFIDQV
jgi:hypothetical protein